MLFIGVFLFFTELAILLLSRLGYTRQQARLPTRITSGTGETLPIIGLESSKAANQILGSGPGGSPQN